MPKKRLNELLFFDEDFTKLLKKRDCHVIAQLYDAYGSTMYGYVLRIVFSKRLAEEVVQDTFLKVWLYGASYDPLKGRFLTWLLNIAHNTAIDATRRGDFSTSQKTGSIDTLIDTYGGECLNLDTIGLQEIVKRIDTKYKILIDLIYFNQYTYKEAAVELGIPLGTVKTRMRNAILELKKAFDIC